MVQEADKKTPTSFDEKIAAHQAYVDKLNDDYKKKPSDELRMEIKRRTDTIYYLRNLAKEDLKVRAIIAAEAAKKFVLSKAIVQPFG